MRVFTEFVILSLLLLIEQYGTSTVLFSTVLYRTVVLYCTELFCCTVLATRFFAVASVPAFDVLPVVVSVVL
jgi:hypothetical protein